MSINSEPSKSPCDRVYPLIIRLILSTEQREKPLQLLILTNACLSIDCYELTSYE